MAFEYPSNAVEDVTRYKFQHYFKGSEMVVAGKLRDQGPDVLVAKVSGQTVSVAESSWSKGAAGAAGAARDTGAAFVFAPKGLCSSTSPTKFQLIDLE